MNIILKKSIIFVYKKINNFKYMTTLLLKTNDMQTIPLIKAFAEKLGVSVVEIRNDIPITEKLAGIFATKEKVSISDKEAKTDYLLEKLE
ncbi:MAG: hypothetical protein EAZ85_15675 [Bacteroidetes bacterium]|nr:MAG: hypothetical protein EAZ85_15675 [Bacteroidota bacterium]TAG85837.1 MAG: hypothetical protein EAZ20_14070 [Bacteroidota bacterium]